MTKRTIRIKKAVENDDNNEFHDGSPFPAKVKVLVPKGERQKEYLSAIENFKVVFATGPSGVGKTWVSVAYAADQLKAGKIQKILVTRPAVEVGETLGFLPGELQEKFAPYLTPVIEVLNERLGKSFVELLIKSGKIEATPIGLLRGRSINDTFILVSEAQNATPVQMKMILTRIGYNSTMVIEGDLKQQDTIGKSGLEDAIEKISFIPSVKVVKFTKEDIVRSGIVAEIVEAYEG